jgi:hypothetical protein
MSEPSFNWNTNKYFISARREKQVFSVICLLFKKNDPVGFRLRDRVLFYSAASLLLFTGC